ncbi:CAMK family protein kinase [Histomonas meleagridis]|uniref:CAMK family protein kinase n=1 Tax=Histomonas meleagridis TaxID=135588 RepID=UPI003559BA14|nr:CAMK family protein kinase [Histomonas meleagridis]KAH0798615.1 CAMK family protein kinase [Histomonas meleagridis]
MILNQSQQISVTEIQHVFPEHHYQYKKPIGAGGNGSVFLVSSDKYHQDFCIKRIPQNSSTIDEAKNEATTLIRLCHPNIISMYEFFFDENHTNLYIVLEHCGGGSLKDLIDKEGPIRPPKLYSFCYQILKALLHCHEQNVAHRDIKPANILLDNYGRPKLADFGLSKRFEKGEIINSYSGSLPYMAPEIICHQNTDPFLADIWSLGITFYQIAFGRLPWGKCNESELEIAIKIGFLEFPPYADPEFCKLIRSMAAVNPQRRESIQLLLRSPIFDNIQKYNYISLLPSYEDPSPNGFRRRSLPGLISSVSHSRLLRCKTNKSCLLKRPDLKSNPALRKTFVT